MLTGQIGKVMEESARAALSYVRSHWAEFGIPKGFFEDHAIHIHVPAGAIPKDGPSAGVTMATAIVSALSGRRVRREVAMTGEITLRGRVLPIGGVKEKLLAAHRAGIKVFILPEKNKKDLVDIPKEVLDTVEIRTASVIDDVLKIALQPGQPAVTPAQIEASRAAATPPAH
jgi:ATP-dependent Lon protease